MSLSNMPAFLGKSGEAIREFEILTGLEVVVDDAELARGDQRAKVEILQCRSDPQCGVAFGHFGADPARQYGIGGNAISAGVLSHRTHQTE